MQRARITIIARREVEEIASDWRMLVPLIVLTFFVPLFMACALLFAIRVLNDQLWVASMLPLALLTSGFLPAGFAVVNASESLVGEKERNTIESLLATPLTDGEVYFGKLAGALVPPLGSSSLAVATLVGLIMLQLPAAVAGTLTPWLITLIVATSILKTVILVAGAIAVSIHASTVRGANLVAAFLLVPLGALVNLEAYLLVERNVGSLLWSVGALAVPAVLLVYIGFTTLKREAILSRDQGNHDVARTFAASARLIRRFGLWRSRPQQPD
jgi:ABC-type transport system involved in multi-copper enzyme maturation permease subunit